MEDFFRRGGGRKREAESKNRKHRRWQPQVLIYPESLIRISLKPGQNPEKLSEFAKSQQEGIQISRPELKELRNVSGTVLGA